MISMVGGEVQEKSFVDLEFVFVFIFKKRLDSVDVLVLGNI